MSIKVIFLIDLQTELSVLLDKPSLVSWHLNFLNLERLLRNSSRVLRSLSTRGSISREYYVCSLCRAVYGLSGKLET